MKLLARILVVIMMLFTQIPIVYAEGIDNTKTIGGTGVLLDDPTLSKAQIIENKEKADYKDMFFAMKNLSEANYLSGDPDGEWYYINVTNYTQETNTWCGPAAARQSLSFHKTKSGSSVDLPSQTTLASRIGTGASGSATTGIRDALNYYASTFGFSSNLYVVGDIKDYSNPTYVLETRIKNALRYGANAPILLIDTRHLSRYNGTEIRHYNTVSGYSHEYATNNKRIRMVDPHYDANYRGIFWDSLDSPTLGGVFPAVYQADIDGTNYVMCY